MAGESGEDRAQSAHRNPHLMDTFGIARVPCRRVACQMV
jgi:DNA-directed RNA polymerase subunit N (RpoN/RPB10)